VLLISYVCAKAGDCSSAASYQRARMVIETLVEINRRFVCRAVKTFGFVELLN